MAKRIYMISSGIGGQRIPKLVWDGNRSHSTHFAELDVNGAERAPTGAKCRATGGRLSYRHHRSRSGGVATSTSLITLSPGEVLEGEVAAGAAKHREESKQVEQESNQLAEIFSVSAPTDQSLGDGRSFGDGQAAVGASAGERSRPSGGDATRGRSDEEAPAPVAASQ